MAIHYLKHGRTAEESSQDAAKVRDTVTGILADVTARGDEAVRELSAKFDNWSPERFRLSDEIAAAVRSLSQGQLDDIKFAQAQVRNFAQAQRESIRDIEVETLPGVVLGHKNMPVDSVACYVPGGKFPLVASAHMGVVTAKVAGVPRIITASPPCRAARIRPWSRPCISAARTRSTPSAACRRLPRWRSARRASIRSRWSSARAMRSSPKRSASCSAVSAST
jgi:histidinol dehydrogenase